MGRKNWRMAWAGRGLYPERRLCRCGRDVAGLERDLDVGEKGDQSRGRMQGIWWIKNGVVYAKNRK